VVARATSAAPTYFEPSAVDGRSLIDGGVFAVNPAMAAFAEARRFEPDADVVLLSLGTGERTRRRSFSEIED
jgi:patatin-like phospholipase/acyl hydrolase